MTTCSRRTLPRRPRASAGFAILALLLGLAVGARRGEAQDGRKVGGRNEIFAGSELEEYLRVLQVAGESVLYPWSVRAFSPREVDRLAPGDSLHPWAARYALEPRRGRAGLHAELIPPRIRTVYNSAFAYGLNDGPVWAGRGLTTAVQAGFSARYGPLSLTVAPTAFRAENAGFELDEHLNRPPFSRFADSSYPHWIDLPQRFGEQPYARVDPGQSTLRVDLPALSAGISTANQYWGPASEHPILLGNNAPGFPHLFLGTSAPVDLWIARAHGKLVWGRLDQSEHSPVREGDPRRLMTGAIGVLVPRGAPGLEIGLARFFHNGWPEDGLGAEDFTQPFESLLKVGLPIRWAFGNEEQNRSSADNQLASVFARWVFPRSGFELYGEFGREDHNFDLRDFFIDPTQQSGYMLGARKVWDLADDRLLSLRGEVLSTQVSHTVFIRGQWPFYIHAQARQGHTQRGEALGSVAGYAGGGSVLSLAYYTPRGKWSVDWRRMLRNEWGEYWIEEGATQGGKGVDLVHALGASGLFFLGPLDVTAGVTGAYNFNRYFQRDVLNWNASLGLRAGL